MPSNEMRPELEKVLAWAKAKIATRQELPWAWYRYVKLEETLEAILQGMTVTLPPESSQPPAKRPERHLRLVKSD